jgi:hypothetical protein
VVKTGKVVWALGEKLNAGAVFALVDGGCQVVAGTRAGLAKFGAGQFATRTGAPVAVPARTLTRSCVRRERP